MADEEPRRIELRIPFATLLKVALFVLLVLIVRRLAPLLLLVVIATLVSIILTPAQRWMEQHGVRRGIAILLIAIIVFGAFAAFLVIVVPRTAAQSAELVKKVPELGQHVIRIWPAGAPYVQTLLGDLQKPPNPHQTKQYLIRGMSVGRYVVSGIAALVFTLVLSLYFVLDGKRLLAWLVSFGPRQQRKKLAQTFEEVRPVVFAYMRGQLITSFASFFAALAVLLPMHVPGAWFLAILALIGDFIPVVGFIASLIPAVLLALTVSPTAALIVLAGYMGYQALENYLIAPRVYGRAMELSNATVLLGIACGGILLGPIGAILILPFLAAYPSVERIWLADYLADGTVERHEAVEQGATNVV
ncbi:MAG TPA: AI-2E family transporter [Thermoanaerobaculia bacterium]|nr:AI-2E family transporter [Thermoanaerobaculia bacterium]